MHNILPVDVLLLQKRVAHFFESNMGSVDQAILELVLRPKLLGVIYGIL